MKKTRKVLLLEYTPHKGAINSTSPVREARNLRERSQGRTRMIIPEPQIEQTPRKVIDLLSCMRQNGDVSAWGELFKLEKDFLICYLFKQFDSINAKDAEDIVANTLLKVFEKAKTFRGSSDGEAKEWIRTILHNEAISSFRKFRQEFTPHSEDGASSRDCHRDVLIIKKFLKSLKERELEILKKSAAGFSSKEIASDLGLTPARVSEIKKEIRQKAVAAGITSDEI
jgi:RNA polymerase sigma factor (sigma-70 family)